jgi:hypothetical protein
MNLKTIEDLMTPAPDPRVVKAGQKLKEFESKQQDLAAQIQSITGEYGNLEKQIASAMLNGSDPKTQRLTTLGNRKTEIESEHRMLGSVIDQARATMKEITAESQRERDLRELQALSTALDQFIEALGPVLEAQAVLERAFFLQAISAMPYLRSCLYEITKVHREALSYKSGILQSIENKRDSNTVAAVN